MTRGRAAPVLLALAGFGAFEPEVLAANTVTLDLGVIAASIAGGATIGGSWQHGLVQRGRSSLELRAAAHVTGLQSGAIGVIGQGFAVGTLDLSRVAPVLIDLGLGIDALTLRACGPVNCGRLTGIVPAASARVVVLGDYWDGAVGLALTGGWTYADSPTVAAGSLWSFALGPYWRIGRKD